MARSPPEARVGDGLLPARACPRPRGTPLPRAHRSRTEHTILPPSDRSSPRCRSPGAACQCRCLRSTTPPLPRHGGRLVRLGSRHSISSASHSGCGGDRANRLQATVGRPWGDLPQSVYREQTPAPVMNTTVPAWRSRFLMLNDRWTRLDAGLPRNRRPEGFLWRSEVPRPSSPRRLGVRPQSRCHARIARQFAT